MAGRRATTVKSRKPTKQTAKTTEVAGKGRKAVHVLTGTATAKALVRVEARITDAKYEVDILKNDIDNKRVWFEAPTDDQGWMKLLYSADGPTGDPWPIGKIRIYLDPDQLDANFGNLTELTVKEVEP
jgi:hypothetical protein